MDAVAIILTGLIGIIASVLIEPEQGQEDSNTQIFWSSIALLILGILIILGLHIWNKYV